MLYLYIGIGIFVFVLLLSTYIARTVFLPKTFTHEECLQYDYDASLYDETYLSEYDVKDVYVKNDGLKLHAQFIDNKSEKSIILMHGYTSSCIGMYKYLKPYLANGFNVLLPDQRFHGTSEGENTTLSLKEHTDLNKWIEYIQRLCPKTKIIGIHGESMGAATVLQEGHNEDVSFVISDCSFSSFRLQLSEQIWRNNKIPGFFVYPASIMSKLLFDAPIVPIRPIDNVKNIKVPLLLVHGDQDKLIDKSHFEALKKESKETDSFYLCEGADHAVSYNTNPKEYDRVVTEFLKNNNII